MPPSAGRLRVRGYFTALFVILIALYAIVFFSSQSNTPKLGLDLEGGAQAIFQAVTTDGKAPSSASMKVARQILTTRVNGLGVSEATVEQQGNNRIVVSVPGKTSSQIADIGKAAQLNFRPVVVAPIPASTASASTSGSATPSTTATGATSSGTASSSSTGTATKATTAGTPATSSSAANLVSAPTPSTAGSSTTAKASATPSATPSSSAPAVKIDQQDPLKGLGFTAPTTDTAFSKLTQAQQLAIYERLSAFTCKTDSAAKPIDRATQDYIACGTVSGQQAKYLLGPVIVPGNQISTARAVAPQVGQQGGSSEWTVALDLKSGGQKAWANYTAAHHSTASSTSTGVTGCTPDFSGQNASGGLPCAEYVGFTLDGDVISAPHNEATINGTTSISGGFTDSSATELANQLKFGALPLSFNLLTSGDVSATLGLGQLRAGLLAGGIGLALVVLYSLVYYRGLGFVTIASLLVSGGLTYASLVILGRQIGFTLTLAGIAGFIVAIGITADSFVVFFERIKDEVHEGRSIGTAVPRAWARARRTIISADVVSLMAAVILYVLAAGDVRGFAFTLGLSTLLDLVVVFLFTHPLVSLLSRSRTFGSPRFTGLNAVRAKTALVTEPRRTATASSGSRRRGGGTALLERDQPDADVALGDDSYLDPDAGSDLDEDLTATTPVEAEPDPAEDHKASAEKAAARRRARTEREAVVDTGLSAAERAAARRGRTVRPPTPDEPETVEADTKGADTDTADTDDVTDVEVERPVAASPGISEFPEPALAEADVPEPVTESLDERPVVDTSTDDAAVDMSTGDTGELTPAARRAAERRARLQARKSGGEA